ncbi:MAG TPA: hypothetical protein VFM18_02655 [Methanosarcina sp.]|nr:hypothetical protein [Methanosarcina sp.]
MTINFTKPVQTRDGLPVRILCTDRKDDYPIVGLVKYQSGEEVRTWTDSGSYSLDLTNRHKDLMNVPETKIYYMNVYWNRVGVYNSSLEQAHSNINESAQSEYICTLKLTYENDVLVKKEIVE